MVDLVICKTCTQQTLDYGKCYNCGGETTGCRLIGKHSLDTCPMCWTELIDSHCKPCEAIPYSIRMSDAFQNPPPQKAPKDLEGRFDNVGNCLAELIPQWAVASQKGCKCKDHQATWNKWGTDQCEANFEIIVSKLKQQKKYLRGAMKLIPDGVAETGVRYLVRKAIEMSREK